MNDFENININVGFCLAFVFLSLLSLTVVTRLDSSLLDNEMTSLLFQLNELFQLNNTGDFDFLKFLVKTIYRLYNLNPVQNQGLIRQELGVIVGMLREFDEIYIEEHPIILTLREIIDKIAVETVIPTPSEIDSDESLFDYS